MTNPGGHPVTLRLAGTGVPVVFAEPTVRVPARTRADVPFTMTVPAGVRKWSCGGRGCRKASPRLTSAVSCASVPRSRPVTGSAASMTRRCAAVGGRVTVLLPEGLRSGTAW
ncbi:hypothetical protein [Streptomyces shenzhenensis]|uniref:hypothetical protein n=1 Tax=Streptomyces shenzhenensis TaxID=943815 RepID=UPI0038D45AF9